MIKKCDWNVEKVEEYICICIKKMGLRILGLMVLFFSGVV